MTTVLDITALENPWSTDGHTLLKTVLLIKYLKYLIILYKSQAYLNFSIIM